MSLLSLKVAAALLVLAIGASGAFLPWILRAKAPSDRSLARGDTFAGGVLGGAGLVHLLAGGIDGFRALAPELGYPLAPLLTGIGFLLILLIEGVIVGERPLADPPRGPYGHPAVSHELGAASVPPERGRPYAYILLLVLSVHSVIVGLTLGAQQSASGVMVVLAAVVAHKGVAGFALGVSYARTGSWRRAAPGIAFFATMTPVGILAGAAVAELAAQRGAGLFEAVFDSLGAGTFLYIAALDIISTEFSATGDRWGKWLSACLGFGIMALLAVWI